MPLTSSSSDIATSAFPTAQDVLGVVEVVSFYQQMTVFAQAAYFSPGSSGSWLGIEYSLGVSRSSRAEKWHENLQDFLNLGQLLTHPAVRWFLPQTLLVVRPVDLADTDDLAELIEHITVSRVNFHRTGPRPDPDVSFAFVKASAPRQCGIHAERIAMPTENRYSGGC
jgi:hypothetical protein